jgi:hypothetical protein
MKVQSVLTAVIVAAAMGCADSGDADEGALDLRSGQVAECVTGIHIACGQHMADIFLAAEDLPAVDDYERDHFDHSRDLIVDFYYWLDSMSECANDDGAAPDTVELERLGVDVYQALTTHRLRMRWAATLDEAWSLERKYQAQMTWLVNDLRVAHDNFELAMNDYTCPTAWPHPDRFGDVTARQAPDRTFRGDLDETRPTRNEFIGDQGQQWRPGRVLWHPPPMRTDVNPVGPAY